MVSPPFANLLYIDEVDDPHLKHFPSPLAKGAFVVVVVAAAAAAAAASLVGFADVGPFAAFAAEMKSADATAEAAELMAQVVGIVAVVIAEDSVGAAEGETAEAAVLMTELEEIQTIAVSIDAARTEIA